MPDSTSPLINPWHPMSKPIDLKFFGKLGEELGECSSAVSRCIIQGLEECEPVTGKLNREWLEDEMADVLANIELVMERYELDKLRIFARAARKKEGLKTWHNMLDEG